MKKKKLFVFLLPGLPWEPRCFMWFSTCDRGATPVWGELSAQCVHKVKNWCLLQVCINMLGLLILSIYYFHAWQRQMCEAFWEGSKLLNSLLTDWQVQPAQFCPITRFTVKLIFSMASCGEEKSFPIFFFFFLLQKHQLLTGRPAVFWTEPISLIRPMVFPGFASTWLGFVSEDSGFGLLSWDLLGLAGF